MKALATALYWTSIVVGLPLEFVYRATQLGVVVSTVAALVGSVSWEFVGLTLGLLVTLWVARFIVSLVGGGALMHLFKRYEKEEGGKTEGSAS